MTNPFVIAPLIVIDPLARAIVLPLVAWERSMLPLHDAKEELLLVKVPPFVSAKGIDVTVAPSRSRVPWLITEDPAMIPPLAALLPSVIFAVDDETALIFPTLPDPERLRAPPPNTVTVSLPATDPETLSVPEPTLTPLVEATSDPVRFTVEPETVVPPV